MAYGDRQYIGPLRRVVSTDIRVARGRGTYRHDHLECGHDWHGEMNRMVRAAKKRRCGMCGLLERINGERAAGGAK